MEDIADRLFNSQMVAADVKDAVTSQKIEVSAVIHVGEVRAFGTGIDFVETDDALGCDESAIEVFLVQLIVFAESRGDDFFEVETHGVTKFPDSAGNTRGSGGGDTTAARRDQLRRRGKISTESRPTRWTQ